MMQFPVRKYTEGDYPKEGELVIHAELMQKDGSHQITLIVSAEFLENCGKDAVKIAVDDIVTSLKLAQKERG